MVRKWSAVVVKTITYYLDGTIEIDESGNPKPQSVTINAGMVSNIEREILDIYGEVKDPNGLSYDVAVAIGNAAKECI